MIARALDAVSAQAARLSALLIVVMAVVMMASLILQIIFRYLIGHALIWSEELAMFLFTWVALLAGSLGVRDGFHVRLTLFLDLLAKPVRPWAERLIVLLVGAFGAALAWSGYLYLDATLGQVSAAVRYPIEALHSAAPAAGVLIVLHALARLANPAPPAGAEGTPGP
ncbi:MAG: TRAP transporter small permease [Rhodospirillaceae bacterium]|nr:TRAP transporter small permease [Rhodospirillaceae bacterium]